MGMLKFSIDGDLDQEFNLESPLDTSCLQTDTSQPHFPAEADNSHTHYESEQKATHLPGFDENFVRDFGPEWTARPSLDQKKSMELKELTLGLVSDPSPDSDFLVKVSETLNSVLQDELQAIDSDASSPETL